MDQDRNKAWGFALFCDDVRAEVGGKLSLMGLYQADMFLPDSSSAPFVLAKFVVTIFYYEIHDALQEDVTFKIIFDDSDEAKVVAEVPVLRRDIAAARAQAQTTLTSSENPEDSERLFSVRMPVTLSPFVAEKMGRLRVRAHFSDGKILKLGSIGLKQIPEAQFQAMVGIAPPPS
jgi:hypothetical protein